MSVPIGKPLVVTALKISWFLKGMTLAIISLLNAPSSNPAGSRQCVCPAEDA